MIVILFSEANPIRCSRISQRRMHSQIYHSLSSHHPSDAINIRARILKLYFCGLGCGFPWAWYMHMKEPQNGQIGGLGGFGGIVGRSFLLAVLFA